MITAAPLHRASDLFAVERRHDVSHEHLNLSFRPTAGPGFFRGGAGIYTIYFGGRLKYLGIFRGAPKNPSGGDILSTRWARHLETLTVRGFRASLTRKGLDMLEREAPDSMLTDAAKRWAQDLAVFKDRGACTSGARLLFAAKHWHQFQDTATILDHFKFGYVRSDFCDLPVEGVRRKVEAAERRLLDVFQPIANKGWHASNIARPEAAVVQSMIEETLAG